MRKGISCLAPRYPSIPHRATDLILSWPQKHTLSGNHKTLHRAWTKRGCRRTPGTCSRSFGAQVSTQGQRPGRMLTRMTTKMMQMLI